MRDIARRRLRRLCSFRIGELDVLAGCPRCQGFTRMRNGYGAADGRSDLVLRYLDFVAELRPCFAVFENVPRLIRSRHGKEYYAALLSGFSALGYTYVEYLIDAAAYAVTQHRNRIVVIASREGVPLPVLRRTHGAPDSLDVRNGARLPWRTVRQAIAAYPVPSTHGSAEQSTGIPDHVSTRTGHRKSGARDPRHDVLSRLHEEKARKPNAERGRPE